MKSIQIPLTKQDRGSKNINLPSLTLILKIILSVIVLLFILLTDYYILGIATYIAGNLSLYIYRLLKEATALDFSVGDINFTMEDIIEDLER